MSRETLQWLAWLIQQQSVQLGAVDARDQCAHAFRALDEIVAALGAMEGAA